SMRRTIITLAAAVIAMAGAVAVATPAVAVDNGVDAVKAAVTHRINLRLTALARDTTVIGAAKNLSADHRTTLQNLVNADTSGLTALKTKVAGETTLAALKADATSMVDDYRVFILVGPKVRLTNAGDTELAVTSKLREVYTKLAARVAKAKATGTDTTMADQELADLAAELDKADTDTNGQVAALLAISAGRDGAGIQAKVAAVRAALVSGRADLKQAESDAKKVRDFLKGLTAK
ncbi:MAG: hypothetical protein ACM3JP_01590, partial [Betaproteobacteria bacterium]